MEPRLKYLMAPATVWVLARRLRYAYASLTGSNRLAGEKIHISWKRDWDVVSAIKRVWANPPRRKGVDADAELWQTPVGDLWAPAGVSEGFMTMLAIEVLSDMYQFAAQRWSRRLIVLDCGANMGIFSRMALELGAEQVVCFEPSPQTAHCLERTFAAEIEAKRMILVKKAVWDKLETLQLSAAS